MATVTITVTVFPSAPTCGAIPITDDYIKEILEDPLVRIFTVALYRLRDGLGTDLIDPLVAALEKGANPYTLAFVTATIKLCLSGLLAPWLNKLFEHIFLKKKKEEKEKMEKAAREAELKAKMDLFKTEVAEDMATVKTELTGSQNSYNRDFTKPKMRPFAIITFVLTVMALGMADMTTMTNSSASQTCPSSDADKFDAFIEYFENDPVVVYIIYAISRSRDVIVNDLNTPLTDALKKKGTNPFLVAFVTTLMNLALVTIVGTWGNKFIKYLGFGKKKKEKEESDRVSALEKKILKLEEDMAKGHNALAASEKRILKLEREMTQRKLLSEKKILLMKSEMAKDKPGSEKILTLKEEMAKVLATDLVNVKTRLMGRMDGVKTELTDTMVSVKTGLMGRMDDVETELTGRMDDVETELRRRMDDVETELTGRMDDVKTGGAVAGLGDDNLNYVMQSS